MGVRAVGAIALAGDGPDYIAQSRDPSQLGWPATLPLELALKTASPAELKTEYGYSDDEWAALRHDPTFLRELAQALETVKQEGMSFKLKARFQAEELLKTSWKIIHSRDDVSPAVRADLIKSTMRWAGFDNRNETATGNGTALNIQINLR